MKYFHVLHHRQELNEISRSTVDTRQNVNKRTADEKVDLVTAKDASVGVPKSLSISTSYSSATCLSKCVKANQKSHGVVRFYKQVTLKMYMEKLRAPGCDVYVMSSGRVDQGA